MEVNNKNIACAFKWREISSFAAVIKWLREGSGRMLLWRGARMLQRLLIMTMPAIMAIIKAAAVAMRACSTWRSRCRQQAMAWAVAQRGRGDVRRKHRRRAEP